MNKYQTLLLSTLTLGYALKDFSVALWEVLYAFGVSSYQAGVKARQEAPGWLETAKTKTTELGTIVGKWLDSITPYKNED